MGEYLGIFAFRAQPDVSKLEGIEWMSAWRLFKHKDAQAWFLEGPSHEDTISFFEPLQADDPPLDDALKVLADTVTERIDDAGGDKTLFDRQMLMQCSALSKSLGQAVMAAGGNDEGFDSFFAYDEGGAPIGAKFEIDWDKGLVVEPDGTILIDRFYPAGSDEASVKPRFQHQIANEGAREFLGIEDLELTSDPYDFDNSQYRLVHKKGEAPPKDVRLSDVLFQRHGPNPNLSQLLEEFDPYVQAVLAEDLMLDETERRFEIDKTTTGLVVYMSYCRDKPKWYRLHLFNALKSFLSDLSGYTMALRPKPYFRKRASDIPRMRRELSKRWQSIRLEGRILG